MFAPQISLESLVSWERYFRASVAVVYMNHNTLRLIALPLLVQYAFEEDVRVVGVEINRRTPCGYQGVLNQLVVNLRIPPPLPLLHGPYGLCHRLPGGTRDGFLGALWIQNLRK